jgi:hypothetical protein
MQDTHHKGELADLFITYHNNRGQYRKEIEKEAMLNLKG